MAIKHVYHFGGNCAEGAAGMKDLLGGKGANLAEMANLGLPVPPGFTIISDVCTYYYQNQQRYPDGLKEAVNVALSHISDVAGGIFGDADYPLLVSVRSGARVSMPGMMDTVLNLGLNDKTVAGLAERSQDPRFAYDSYRRFIQMYADVVLGVDHCEFEDILGSFKEENSYERDSDIDAAGWLLIIEKYKNLVRTQTKADFPQNAQEQLWGAIGAVFDSWMSARAITYRKLHSFPEDWGTAVTIQAMVFGNMGENSATGVAFTRNPSTGDNALYGEFLVNAQGEDVVAGIRTPQNITEQARILANSDAPSLEQLMPETFSELKRIFAILEKHYCDMQDLEFTIENGKLWMLQTRSGKRTAHAAIKIAVDMVRENLISKAQAVARINPASLDQLLHPSLDPQAERVIIATGLPASPGAACGEIIFSSDEAEKLTAQGRAVILVRVETSPEDIHGMHAAQGILTARGGMTSHAAVVARGMGKPCISGTEGLRIDYKAKTLTTSDGILKVGDIITIDGSTGQVMKGKVAMIQPALSDDFSTLMQWADEFCTMKIRANAETPIDAQMARNFGAVGIGLCRTEHMFFDAERISAMREMILANDEIGRKAALAKILPMQRQDFIEIFEIMAGLPVTIRLLDPPLHEFLPHNDDEIVDVAELLQLSPQTLKARMADLHEFNPMLGHRGVRLAITYPEIVEMQVRALFEAAHYVADKTGNPPLPEIMVPLVATKREFEIIADKIDLIAKELEKEKGKHLPYMVGTMIELPRAALMAGDIAQRAEFFSFGTNDLTQTTFGISRDDSARFINHYIDKGIVSVDPFVSLDQEGVGELVKIAAERGRRARPDLKLGICGEHGGDPASIAFFASLRLDYVSCSPYRVPIARLAAAQASLGLSLERTT